MPAKTALKATTVARPRAALQYEKPVCWCGALTRRKFALPSGGNKNSRTQHARWRVCANGHQLCTKKRRQA